MSENEDKKAVEFSSSSSSPLLKSVIWSETSSTNTYIRGSTPRRGKQHTASGECKCVVSKREAD